MKLNFRIITGGGGEGGVSKVYCVFPFLTFPLRLVFFKLKVSD